MIHVQGLSFLAHVVSKHQAIFVLVFLDHVFLSVDINLLESSY
jgi:hypothetical protein